MRCRMAKLLALATGVLIVAVALLFAAIQNL
jgi:hypothetical protein